MSWVSTACGLARLTQRPEMREITMKTISADGTAARDARLRGRRGVPWRTVIALAAVLAYADGFWLISLRGAIGAIERTDSQFPSWFLESTTVLPVFAFAVLGAMTLALRWFGPKLDKTSRVVATALLIVVGGTVVGLAAIVASSAYDYHLQSAQLQAVQGMSSMHGHCDASCLAQEERDTLSLQVRGVLLVSRWVLTTNLVLVAWVIAVMGGRLEISTTKRWRHAVTEPEPPFSGGRVIQQVRLLLVAALVASAVIHAAVISEHLAEWPAAGVFFILLTTGELAIACLMLASLQQRTVLRAATVISVGPLIVWLYSRTAGMPFGPERGIPESIGVPDVVACTLEIASLFAAVALLHPSRWLSGPSPVSPHVRGLIVLALISATAIGVAGTGQGWFDAFGLSSSQSATSPHH